MSVPALRATYRLQLTPELGFTAAASVVDYLAWLGVSHVHLSPIFEAVPGSMHGYDVTDPTRVRRQLGGMDGFTELCAAARAAGLGIILDIVPNHMAAHATNPLWWDVLRRGRSSPHADVFDIDWDAADGRVVLPTLGRSLDEALQAGELRIDTGSPQAPGETVLRYFDSVFPLRPDLDPIGTPLPELAAAQHYTLMYWRDGEARLNYRRFFDIDDLAAVRVEDESVFSTTHALLARLAAAGRIDGVRVDHVDGLRDPTQYLHRLRALLDEHAYGAITIHVEKILMGDEQLPPAWRSLTAGTTGYEFIHQVEPVLVDQHGLAQLEAAAFQDRRIVEPFEAVCQRSKLQVLERLFPPEVARLTRAISAVATQAGLEPAEDDLLRRAVLAVTASLGVYRTYQGADPPDQPTRRRLDETFARAAALLSDDADAAAALSTVRRVLTKLPSAAEDDALRGAALGCLRSWQQLTGPAAAKGVEDTALYRHVVLCSLNEVGCEPIVRPRPIDTFHTANQARQQLLPRSMLATATHDTKRGEDTRARIHVLSEVADEWNAALPRWARWHEPMRRSLEDGPCPNATHESLAYQSLIGIWPAEGALDDTIAGRLSDYMIKAAREAKRRTSWRRIDDDYESGLRDFVHELVLGEGGARFREDVQPLLQRAMFFGAVNSLSRLVLKLTSPGVPDLYQGTELWDLSLVDPDNRRRVDYASLRAIRDAEGAESIAAFRGSWRDGRIKAVLTRRLLALGKTAPVSGGRGTYHALDFAGGRKAHALGYIVAAGDEKTVVIVGCRCAAMGTVDQWPIGEPAWLDTEATARGLDAGPYRCRLTGHTVECDGARLSVSAALAHLPVAVLVRGGRGDLPRCLPPGIAGPYVPGGRGPRPATAIICAG